MEDYIEQLNALGARKNVPLKQLTSMRVGGHADFVVEIVNEDVLLKALELALPCMLIGNGTNLLASDEGFRGVILKLDSPWYAPKWNGNRVRVSAGMSLTALARESVGLGFSGLERLCGIPGTVGGACAMNAGAYGAEIVDTLKSVRILRDGKISWEIVEKSDMGYRKSKFSFPDCIVLEAEFELNVDDGTATATMAQCLELRNEKQPLTVPSAGSTFKRPQGHFAGALIEQCGLKGLRIGGAAVSNKHAGFIVNDGQGTAKDVIELIELVQKTVLEQTGVQLECEVKRI